MGGEDAWANVDKTQVRRNNNINNVPGTCCRQEFALKDVCNCRELVVNCHLVVIYHRCVCRWMVDVSCQVCLNSGLSRRAQTKDAPGTAYIRVLLL